MPGWTVSTFTLLKNYCLSIWTIASACKRVSPTNIGALCIKLNHRNNAIVQWFVYALVVVRLDNACAHAPQPRQWHMTPKYSRKLALAYNVVVCNAIIMSDSSCIYIMWCTMSTKKGACMRLLTGCISPPSVEEEDIFTIACKLIKSKIKSNSEHILFKMCKNILSETPPLRMPLTSCE